MNIHALSTPTIINFSFIAQAQYINPDLMSLCAPYSFHLQDFALPFASGTILCDVATETPGPYIPSSFCQTVFASLDNL